MRLTVFGASRRSRNAGAALLEFALASLALYLVVAAMLSLGRWMAIVQSAQEAVRIAAREAALFPLPAEFTFEQALLDPSFRSAVYDPDQLVVDLGDNPPGPALEAVFAGMPVVNRALRPLMITSTVDVGGNLRRLLHMPGTIIDAASSPSGLTVVVPRVDERDAATGSETGITIVPVLEEVGPGSFSVASPDRGLVALRLNVPFQSASLSAYVPTGEITPQGDPVQRPALAVDPGGGGYSIVGPGPEGAGPYSGSYGLGEQFALGQSVRPFRRLVTPQALFRREVFL